MYGSYDNEKYLHNQSAIEQIRSNVSVRVQTLKIIIKLQIEVLKTFLYNLHGKITYLETTFFGADDNQSSSAALMPLKSTSNALASSNVGALPMMFTGLTPLRRSYRFCVSSMPVSPLNEDWDVDSDDVDAVSTSVGLELTIAHTRKRRNNIAINRSINFHSTVLGNVRLLRIMWTSYEINK